MLDRKAYTEVQTLVRVTETDSYRIAHHSNYVIWVEMAYRKLLQESLGSIPVYTLTGFACKYKQSALLDDTLQIRLWVKEQPTEEEAVFRFTIRSQRGVELATGTLSARISS